MIEFKKGLTVHSSVSEEVLANSDNSRTEWYHNLTKEFYINKDSEE